MNRTLLATNLPANTEDTSRKTNKKFRGKDKTKEMPEWMSSRKEGSCKEMGFKFDLMVDSSMQGHDFKEACSICAQ